MIAGSKKQQLDRLCEELEKYPGIKIVEAYIPSNPPNSIKPVEFECRLDLYSSTAGRDIIEFITQAFQKQDPERLIFLPYIDSNNILGFKIVGYSGIQPDEVVQLLEDNWKRDNVIKWRKEFR
jgi:hypothetical protein